MWELSKREITKLFKVLSPSSNEIQIGFSIFFNVSYILYSNDVYVKANTEY